MAGVPDALACQRLRSGQLSARHLTADAGTQSIGQGNGAYTGRQRRYIRAEAGTVDYVLTIAYLFGTISLTNTYKMGTNLYYY